MTTRFKRTALVTGAGQRVGKAVALALAEAGVDVAIHYRSSAGPAEAVAEEARGFGVDAFTVPGDLSDTDQTRGVVERVRERWDTLSVLVNNASLFKPRPFEATTLDEVRQMMAVHLEAPLLLAQGLLPLLRAASEQDPELESSLVVNMVDISIERPFLSYTPYAVSKAALGMLIKTMAIELAPAVRTVGLAPGHVAWPPSYDESTKAHFIERIPMGRVGDPSDVGRAIRFLLFDGPYINGDVIKLDGGLAQRY